jgi:hypothetical protein
MRPRFVIIKKSCNTLNIGQNLGSVTENCHGLVEAPHKPNTPQEFSPLFMYPDSFPSSVLSALNVT